MKVTAKHKTRIVHRYVLACHLKHCKYLGQEFKKYDYVVATAKNNETWIEIGCDCLL